MLKTLIHGLVVAAAFLSACASEQKHTEPEWIRQAARTVDNGYIVYVGTGESRDSEKAQFKAEGMALEDLANECSFLPRGTRLEDRFVEKSSAGNKAYVKVAVEFQECTEAQKTLEPSEIKKIANTSFTEQLRRYQDLEETGEIPEKTAYAVLDMPADIPAAPVLQSGWNESVRFGVLRQYVAYQKEVVILAPATVYPAGSPQAVHFVNTIQPAVGQINQVATQNPALVKNPSPWSRIYDRPHVDRPMSLKPQGHKVGYKSALPYIKESDEVKRAARGSQKKGAKRRGHKNGASHATEHRD